MGAIANVPFNFSLSPETVEVLPAASVKSTV